MVPNASVMLFSGYCNRALALNMRDREHRRDLSVLREDENLLNVAVRCSLAVAKKLMPDVQLSQIINDSDVHYVVVQPSFWNYLGATRCFYRMVKRSQLEEVAHISTSANYETQENGPVIYRSLGPIGSKPEKLNIELKFINRQILTQ